MQGARGTTDIATGEERPRCGKTLRLVLLVMCPNIGAYLLILVNDVTNVMLIGLHTRRLPQDDPSKQTKSIIPLAAWGFANLVQNWVALSVGFGFCAALDLLVSDAYKRRQAHVALQHLQAARVLITVNLIWMLPVLWNGGILLQYIFRQKDAVSEDAGKYCKAACLGLFFALQAEANRKYLQNCGWQKSPVAISLLCSALHGCWGFFFIVHQGYGISGAGLANSFTWMVEFFLSSILLVCVRKRLHAKCKELLWLSCRGCCKVFSTFMSYSVPATIQLVLEWWFWEFFTLFAGLWHVDEELAAHVATFNFTSVLMALTVGVNASAACIASGAIQRDHPRMARQVVLICVTLGLLLWTPVAILVMLHGHRIGQIYSGDQNVQKLMGDFPPSFYISEDCWPDGSHVHHHTGLLFVFVVAGFPTTAQNVMGGALRGMGMPQTTAIVHLLSCYFGLCVGVFLAFGTPRMGVLGLYWGLVVGGSAACAFYTFVLCRLDFDELARATAAAGELDATPVPSHVSMQPWSNSQDALDLDEPLVSPDVEVSMARRKVD